MRCKRLTIFEGPDGGGKSTLALNYAKAAGAKYVHFPAMPRVNKGLARMYVEAMLPALLGYQEVVFDRSWLSEEPYGTVFREGQDRLGPITVRMLERLALRCDARVVYCLPPEEVMLKNYRDRKHLEMLDNEDQLEAVREIYVQRMRDVTLPCVVYDYTVDNEDVIIVKLGNVVNQTHLRDVRSAGRWGAPIALVGQDFADRKEHDAFYQWPFASFSRDGCSYWLTQELANGRIGEDMLMWVNADQAVETVTGPSQLIVALGNKAAMKLQSLGIPHAALPHPQYAKRFAQRYELVPLLQTHLKVNQ